MYSSISPFAYVDNNPINNIDPDGRSIIYNSSGGRSHYIPDGYGLDLQMTLPDEMYNSIVSSNPTDLGWTFGLDAQHFAEFATKAVSIDLSRFATFLEENYGTAGWIFSKLGIESTADSYNQLGEGNFKQAAIDFTLGRVTKPLKFGKQGIELGLAAKKVGTKFKSFTKSNYRYNLQVLTGKTGTGLDAHHIFPKAKRFQSQWKRAGINIHDPKNLVWWQLNSHRSAAYGYNKEWDRFFNLFPKASPQSIESFSKSLMKKYGF